MQSLDTDYLVVDARALLEAQLTCISRRASQCEALVVGEYHDDPVAHAVELKLLQQLLQRNGYPASCAQPARSNRLSFGGINRRSSFCPSWHDPRLGYTGSPNLWTALHNDPHLFASSGKATSKDTAAPDTCNSLTPTARAAAPEAPSTTQRPAPADISQLATAWPSPARPQSAPPTPPQQPPASPPEKVPDTFQSLAGVKPGVVTACLSSTLAGPTSGPSMTSAAANAAAADAVRPLIRSGVSYMSQSFSNLYGLLTARRAHPAADDHSTATLTSPPSVASDLDHLPDLSRAPSDQPSHDPLQREPFSHPVSSPTSPGATPRPGTPKPADMPTPVLDARPATAPNPRNFSGPPIAAAGPHHPHAQHNALPYSPWLWSSPDACSHPDLHLYDMGSISAAAAPSDAANLRQPGSKIGLPLPTDFYTSYQRSPLAPPATDSPGAAPASRTPLAAAASAAASAVASTSVAEASAAAAGAPSSLHRSSVSAGEQLPGFRHAADAAVDRIMRGNGYPFSFLMSAGTVCAAHGPCAGAAAALRPPHPDDPQPPRADSRGWAHALRAHYGGVLTWPGLALSSAIAHAQLWSHHSRDSRGQEPFHAAPPGAHVHAQDAHHVPAHAAAGGVQTAIGADLCSAAEPLAPQQADLREVILSLEMFERDVQHVVDEYRAGIISARDLAVDGRAWPNYARDYAPLVDTAASAHARIIAANAPRRYVSLVGRKGPGALQALPSRDAASLPHSSLLTPVSDALRNKIGREFAAAQGGAAPAPPAPAGKAARAAPEPPAPAGKAAPAKEGAECPYVGLRLSDNFLAAQGLWDACMADSILSALGPCGQQAPAVGAGGEMGDAVGGGVARRPLVMHVCGKFHMEERLGICERLAERAPDVSVCTVVLVPVDLPAVRDALHIRRLDEHAAHETVPGMRCSVGMLQGLADFVVLTDQNQPRSF
eukprot:jgi/Ulvmu1/6311/UM029_0018.1